MNQTRMNKLLSALGTGLFLAAIAIAVAAVGGFVTMLLLGIVYGLFGILAPVTFFAGVKLFVLVVVLVWLVSPKDGE